MKETRPYKEAVPLQNWLRENCPPNNLLWSVTATEQIVFVRDVLAPVFDLYGHDVEQGRGAPEVVSEHKSKSVTLPVYRLCYGGDCCSVEVFLRGNFHDWRISVQSTDSNGGGLVLSKRATSLFEGAHYANRYVEGDPIGPVYCEGFSAEWCFDRYRDYCREFTETIRDRYRLFCFVHLLRHDIDELDELPF